MYRWDTPERAERRAEYEREIETMRQLFASYMYGADIARGKSGKYWLNETKAR